MRLDGTHDRAALADELVELVAQVTLRLDQDGRVLSQVEVRRPLEQGLLVEKLNHLAAWPISCRDPRAQASRASFVTRPVATHSAT